MNRLVTIALILIPGACFSQDINTKLILNELQILSSDSMEGRGYGSPGGRKAADYIENKFKEIGVKPAFGNSYQQKFNSTRNDAKYNGQNIVAVIPGKSEKLIIITAHYDHLGIKDDLVYNGADDNASGTVALFALARYFKDKTPQHTIMLAAVDAEETGSIGAQYLLDNFPFKTSNIVLNINLDMIGHNDINELYASGTYFYPQLKEPLTSINMDITLKFGHDSPEYKGADNWTFASDHRVFHRKKVPFIYFGVEDHPDYHQPSDTYENLNEDFYIEVIRFLINATESYDKML